MKNSLKKLFHFCDTCEGILGTHNTFIHELDDMQKKHEERMRDIKALNEILVVISQAHEETPWMWKQRINWQEVNKVFKKVNYHLPVDFM